MGEGKVKFNNLREEDFMDNKNFEGFQKFFTALSFFQTMAIRDQRRALLPRNGEELQALLGKMAQAGRS